MRLADEWATTDGLVLCSSQGKSLWLEDFFSFEHVVDGSSQLSAEHRHGSWLPVSSLQAFHVFLGSRKFSFAKTCRFGEGPAKVGVTNLAIPFATALSVGSVGSSHQPGIREEVTDRMKSFDASDFVKDGEC